MELPEPSPKERGLRGIRNYLMGKEFERTGPNTHKLYRILQGMKKADILKAALKRCKHRHSFFEHPECFANLIPQERVGYLDIETSNLSADYGFIMSYAIKDSQTNKVIGRTLTSKEMLSKDRDKQLVAELNEDIRKYDRIITYYGFKFDVPFIRSRSIKWNLSFPLFKEVVHTDCYMIIKHRMKLGSNRLERACKFLGIAAKTHPMESDVWSDATIGDKKALKYLWEHNVEDVDATKMLYERVCMYSGQTNTSI